MNKTGIFLLSFFIFFYFISLKVDAQQDVRIKRRAFKIEEKEGFQSAWKSRRKGDDFYDKGRGYYDEALEHFLEAYEYNPELAALNYKIGACHFMLGNNEQAIKFLNEALAIDEEVATDVFYLLARAYHFNYAFQDAIRNYQRCLESDIIKDLDKSQKQIDVYIRQCNNGKDLLEEPVRVNINNMGKKINSPYDDYGPVFKGDSVLYFTSRRKHEKSADRWPGDHKFYSNIYRSERKNGEWQKARLVTDEIFSSHNNAILEITSDPLRIYVYLGHEDEGDIYYYEHNGRRWRGPRSISGLINTNAKESSMCLTEDGRGVYFVSDLDDNNTMGGKDIFYSEKDADGKWSYPVNLGGTINTSLNEEGVFVNSTNDKLYFSSEGHNSMGGYDIFMSERDASGDWQKPENIGYPINTPYDDVLYRMIEGESNKGYYATVKEEGYGGKDLYEIVFLGEDREFEYSVSTEPIAWNVRPNKELLYRTPDKLAIDTTIYLTGHIIDTVAGEGIQARLEIIDNQKSQVVATHLSDTNGRYLITLPEQKRYGIEVSAKDYLFFSQSLDFNEMEVVNDTIYKDFILDKVQVGKKVVLENIYFETNSAQLKSSSYPELERVIKLMKDNPGIKLEISGHTDNVGSYVANKKLSESRAKTVVDYLVEHDIDQSRLEYEGYSFTQPIAPNDTPEGRQKNRRVEFEVLEK
ncbi:MAG: OmpA family protein [Bacteroidales bacterium]